MNFNEIRGLYEAAREKEKNNIIDWLVENNFIILNMNDKEAKKPYQTGSGSRNYTARKTIKNMIYLIGNGFRLKKENGNI